MVAILIGCGLRRAALLALTLESVQQREDDWVIADLVGKGGHVRTVPIPTWVKAAVDAWTAAGGITHGPVFRAINKVERVWGDATSAKVLWDVVRAAAARARIEKLVRHIASRRPIISGRMTSFCFRRPGPSCAGATPSRKRSGCQRRCVIFITSASGGRQRGKPAVRMRCDTVCGRVSCDVDNQSQSLDSGHHCDRDHDRRRTVFASPGAIESAE
jgi:hypothetical protein